MRHLKYLFKFDACLRNTEVGYRWGRPRKYHQDQWCRPSRSLGTHDTLSRALIWTFHGRVVVLAARAHRVSFELMVTSQPISSKYMLGLPIFDACFYEAVFLHSVAWLFWPTVKSISNENYAHHIGSIF